MSTKPTILVIEKDEDFRTKLCSELKDIGIKTRYATSFDLELLSKYINLHNADITLIGGDYQMMEGMTKLLRSDGIAGLRIIANLTSDQSKHKVDLYKAGIDQHFDRPISCKDLAAILKAISKRVAEKVKPDTLQYADIKVDLIQNRVWRGGRQIELNAKELSILILFLLSPETIISKEALFKNVWKTEFLRGDNVVESQVRYLRKKLGEPSIIHTKKNKGYILTTEEM